MVKINYFLSAFALRISYLCTCTRTNKFSHVFIFWQENSSTNPNSHVPCTENLRGDVKGLCWGQLREKHRLQKCSSARDVNHKHQGGYISTQWLILI